MVPCVKFVFATLIILNYIGFVSPQNELEYGLATDCKSKSNYSFILQNFSKFVDNICYILGFVCGDKCINLSQCKCGDSTFGENDYSYCCILRNETCQGVVLYIIYIKLFLCEID